MGKTGQPYKSHRTPPSSETPLLAPGTRVPSANNGTQQAQQSTDETMQLVNSSPSNTETLKGQPDILTCVLIFITLWNVSTSLKKATYICSHTFYFVTLIIQEQRMDLTDFLFEKGVGGGWVGGKFVVT